MTAGMRFGYRRGLWNILGLQLGITFILVVVAAGLGAVLAASATAFAVVKWLGVAYLVWLGIQQWRAPAAPIAVDGGGVPADGTRRALVLRGFLVNATNPKGLLFMLAVLPQFIDPARPQLAAIRDLRGYAHLHRLRRDERIHGTRRARAPAAARPASPARDEPGLRRPVRRGGCVARDLPPRGLNPPGRRWGRRPIS